MFKNFNKIENHEDKMYDIATCVGIRSGCKYCLLEPTNFFLLIVKSKYSAKFSSTPPNSEILRQILKYSTKFSNTLPNPRILLKFQCT